MFVGVVRNSLIKRQGKQQQQQQLYYHLRCLSSSSTTTSNVSSFSKMSNPSIIDLSRFADNQNKDGVLPKEALERDIEMRREHFAMRKDFPENAQPKNGEMVDAKLAHRKRLIYRAKQRGWLEVDILLGSFAVDHVMDFTDEEAAQFEAILNCETLDIYNMISEQMEIPKVLQTPMMNRLQTYAKSSPAGVADPEGYARIKSKMSN